MSEMRPERAWFDRAAQDKGFLVARDLPFRFVHDLIYLAQLCMAREPAFKELMPAAEILGEYGAAMRYPIEGGEDPDMEKATEAIRLAEQVAAMVLRR